MKSIGIMLAALLSLSACSKDNGELSEAVGDTQPKQGQYVYSDKTITAAIYLDGSSSVSITVFENGRYVYQSKAGHVSIASWPVYQYDFSGLCLICSYASSTDFTVSVDNNVTGAGMPARMRFTYNTTTLDANGDGVLDSWQ